MKFTKEEAFESLKGILTNGGKKPLRMSEKSINKQLEALIPLIANDDMELSDFVSKVKESFSVMNSNAEKDNSDFVKQWEKDHPQANPEPPKSDDSKPDDAMSKMMQRLEELEKKEAMREKETKISVKRSELLKAMKDKGIKDEQWCKDLVSEISLSDDTDVGAKADSFLKLYNKSKASTGNGNVTPKDTSRSGDNRNENPFKEASEMKKKEREQFNNFKQ